jgi:CheY-like chemotaxis protein
MDAVGRLAGGVAHDFNNLLTAIQGYSEMLLRSLPNPSPHRADAEEILKAAERGAMLSRQLLAFGERERVQPRTVDLNAVVIQMESLIQRLLGADVQVVIDRAPEVPTMRIDPALLEQVLVSLVLNAREAMSRGGTLTIETGERDIEPGSRSRSLKPGRYTVLSVSDTGDGGEPGAALELPIVYSIVRQTGGVVRVTSEPGQGTTVRAYFPTADEDVAAVEESPRRGDETVLVVEDEEPVRELLRKVLSRQGYTVLEARHGRDALRLLERHRGSLDLMVTDVVMPEMGGAELVENVRQLRPDLRTLFISGYTNDEVVRRGADAGEAAFIQKPFTSDELLRAVRELLDKSVIG